MSQTTQILCTWCRLCTQHVVSCAPTSFNPSLANTPCHTTTKTGYTFTVGKSEPESPYHIPCLMGNTWSQSSMTVLWHTLHRSIVSVSEPHLPELLRRDTSAKMGQSKTHFNVGWICPLAHHSWSHNTQLLCNTNLSHGQQFSAASQRPLRPLAPAKTSETGMERPLAQQLNEGSSVAFATHNHVTAWTKGYQAPYDIPLEISGLTTYVLSPDATRSDSDDASWNPFYGMSNSIERNSLHDDDEDFRGVIWVVVSTCFEM